MPETVLTIKNMSKTFPGQKALKSVSMDIIGGEIHALVGQNGSGKSTLVKCLSGFYEADKDPNSQVIVNGVNLRLPITLSTGHNTGIAFVHQDLGLIMNMTVLENLCLGSGYRTGFAYKIRWAKEADRVRKLLASFGRDIDPWALVGKLSSADRTILAIVRALDMSGHGKVLVLDEPTAALPQHEVDYLFAAIRQIASTGVGIIYISHRLNEIFALTNRVSVLRDGVIVGTFPVESLDQNKLINLITGKALDLGYMSQKSTLKEAEMILKVEKLAGEKIHDVSFSIKRGEVVGLAGLLGSGCSELGRLLFGDKKRTAGRIWLKGEELVRHNPRQAMDKGMALVTDDRKQDGLFLNMMVQHNVTITDVKRFCGLAGRIKSKDELAEVNQLINTYHVSPPEAERLIYTLSGGNQQKAIIAKWMRLKPDLLICDEPVQGVDVGSKSEIFNEIRRAASQGAAVLVMSSDFQDLVGLCDRVMVLSNGQLCGCLEGTDITEQAVASLANFS